MATNHFRIVLLWTLLSVLYGTSSAGQASSNSNAYPLSTCAVSGTALGADQQLLRHAGREIRVCSDSCAKQFKADASPHLSRLDAAIIERQSKLYPIDSCVITGEKLGEEAFHLVHGNRLLTLCCAGCRDAFDKDSDGYVEALDAAAIADQLESYPLQNCAVTGSKLGGMGEPFNYVVAGRLVRLCCSGCVNELEKSPSAALAALDTSMPDASGKE